MWHNIYFPLQHGCLKEGEKSPWLSQEDVSLLIRKWSESGQKLFFNSFESPLFQSFFLWEVVEFQWCLFLYSAALPCNGEPILPCGIYSSWSSWTNKGGIAKIIEIYYRIYRVWKLEEYSPSEERDLDATRPSVRPRCYKASLQGSFIKAEIR